MEKLNVYNWVYEPRNILELKKWVDKQIEEGNEWVRLGMEWGYYDDIEELELIATKKK